MLVCPAYQAASRGMRQAHLSVAVLEHAQQALQNQIIHAEWRHCCFRSFLDRGACARPATAASYSCIYKL